MRPSIRLLLAIGAFGVSRLLAQEPDPIADSGSVHDTFGHAAVPNQASGTVSILDTAHEAAVATLPFGPNPRYAAASPDGRSFYVAGTADGGSAARIAKIDIETRAVVQQLDFTVSGSICELELSPDGRYLVACSAWPPMLYSIDAASLTVLVTYDLSGSEGAWPEVAFEEGFPLVDVDTAFGIATLGLDRFRLANYSPVPGQALPTPYPPDMETLPGVPGLVFFIHPYRFSAHSTTAPASSLLAFTPSTLDLCTFRLGREHFIAYGGWLSYGGPRALVVRHVSSGASANINAPTATRTAFSMQSLRFDLVHLEVLAVQPRDPTSVVVAPPTCWVFDLVRLEQRAAIPVPGYDVVSPSVTAGIPSFAPNYRRFFMPMSAGDSVQVIDAETKTLRSRIRVGAQPMVIVMQGDARTREGY